MGGGGTWPAMGRCGGRSGLRCSRRRAGERELERRARAPVSCGEMS
jgi:hypothetical protein